MSKSGARKQMNYNSTRVQDAIVIDLNCQDCKDCRIAEMKEIKKNLFQVPPRKGKGNGFYRDHAIQGFQVLPTYRVRTLFFSWVYFFLFYFLFYAQFLFSVFSYSLEY